MKSKDVKEYLDNSKFFKVEDNLPGIYKLIGTKYSYFYSRKHVGNADQVWGDMQLDQWVSFSEVFKNISNDIRIELAFHLDLFED